MLRTIGDIFSRSEENGGRHCKFYKESGNVGIKSYRYKDDCLSAFAGQLFLFKKGLAPKCWGMSEFTIRGHYSDTVIYYFFTEMVEVCEYKDYDAIQEFADKIRETSKVIFIDTCYFNAGRFEDGSFCVIDTCDSITDLLSGVEI